MTFVIRGRRRSAVWLAMAGAGFVLVSLAGCGENKYTYVTNDADDTYMRVPNGWKVFEVAPQSGSAAEGPWQRAFDAAADPTLDHVAEPAPAAPAGRLTVFYIDAPTADTLSSAAVRAAISPIEVDPLELGTDTAKVEGTVKDYRIDVRNGGVKGSRIVFEYAAGTSKVTYDQTTLVDPKVYTNPTTGRAMFKVYALSVHCESGCFEKNKVQITDIVDSWQVTR